MEDKTLYVHTLEGGNLMKLLFQRKRLKGVTQKLKPFNHTRAITHIIQLNIG